MLYHEVLRLGVKMLLGINAVNTRVQENDWRRNEHIAQKINGKICKSNKIKMFLKIIKQNL